MGAERYDGAAVVDAGAVIVPARGLLFDADGVLVDSDGSIERSWVRWAHRWDHDPATVLAGIHGRRSDDTVALLVDHADRARALADIDRYELEDVGAVTACPGAAELLASPPGGRCAAVVPARGKLCGVPPREAGARGRAPRRGRPAAAGGARPGRRGVAR